MREIFPGRTEQGDATAKNQTTLIIDEVPSDLAYGILMETLNKGVLLTQEELSQEVSRRMDGDKLTVHFAELEGMFIDLLNNKVSITNEPPSKEEEIEEIDTITDNYYDEVREEEQKNDYIKKIITGVKDELRTKYQQNESCIFEDISTPNPPLRDEDHEVYMEHLLR